MGVVPALTPAAVGTTGTGISVGMTKGSGTHAAGGGHGVDVGHSDGVGHGVKSLTLNGEPLSGSLVPADRLGQKNRIKAILG